MDPAVLQTLEMLAEQDGVLRHQILQLATLVDKQQDLVQQLLNVMGVMKDRVDAKEMIQESAIKIIEHQEVQTEGDK